MDYKTLKKGSLRVVAAERAAGRWRRDYQAMRGEMFFSEPPDFSGGLGRGAEIRD